MARDRFLSSRNHKGRHDEGSKSSVLQIKKQESSAANTKAFGVLLGNNNSLEMLLFARYLGANTKERPWMQFWGINNEEYGTSLVSSRNLELRVKGLVVSEGGRLCYGHDGLPSDGVLLNDVAPKWALFFMILTSTIHSYGSRRSQGACLNSAYYQ